MNVNDFFLVNVFTGRHARGNQTCVLMLEDIEDTDLLKRLTDDFNLPATTFLKPLGNDSYEVRWLAPGGEIRLCGHGSMGATHVLIEATGCDDVTLRYADGTIIGQTIDDQVVARFDRMAISAAEVPDHVMAGFHGLPEAYFTSAGKHIVVLPNEQDVRNMRPDWDALRKSDTFVYAITAPGADYDCVSRVILPHLASLEDMATGSAHVVLAEYWSKRLNKQRIHAFQASQRGGEMICLWSERDVALQARCEVFATGSLRP